MILCFRRRKRPEDALYLAFQNLRLEPHQQIALQERYLSVIVAFSKRARRLDFLFHGTRFCITVGSLMVPALQSVQQISNVSWVDIKTFQSQIYWSTLILSLIVTICNGLLTLFKFDKAYYFTHTTYELLKSEGWQYVALTGKYATKEDAKEEATHFNQFRVFYHNAEKIKLRQVEEEYYKFTDLPQTTQQANGKPLMPQQTPSGPQEPLPKKEQKVVDNWSQDLRGGMMDYFMNPRMAMRRTATGIQPRVSRSPIDGTPASVTATTEIPSFAAGSSLPMQPPMRAQASTGETVVPIAPVSGNTAMSSMSEQSSERSRASSGDGSLEQQERAAGEP